MSEDDGRGCNVGCVAVAIACLAVDALSLWTAWQVVQGIAWLASLMAYA